MAFIGWEIVVLVFVAVLFLWGPRKIPEIAKALGQAKRVFEEGGKTQGPGTGSESCRE